MPEEGAIEPSLERDGSSRSSASPRRAAVLSIPTRIFIAFALIIAAFAGVAITSVVQHARTAELLRLLNEGYLPLALRLGAARTHQEGYWRQVERSAESSPAAYRLLQAARQLRPSTQRQLDHYLERAERLAERAGDGLTLPPVNAALAEVDRTLSATRRQYAQLFTALEKDDRAGAADAIELLRRPEATIGRRYSDAYAHLQERSEAIGALAAERERQAAITLGILVVLALLVGVAGTVWSQRLLSPLPALQARVAAVAEGDLSARASVPARDDELGRLASDFEAMVGALGARDQRLRELRRMQAQIVAGLRAAIVVVGGDGTIRTVNPSAAEVLGLDPSAEGTPLAGSSLARRLPELESHLAAVRRDDSPCFLREVPLRADAAGAKGSEAGGGSRGSERFVDLLVAPFAAERGSVLLVVDDVTEALRTKARLIQTERLAAIGRMAAHVTHEVRNPLSSIGLNAEMLEDEIGEAGTEARALLAAIQKEIDRLTALTEEYLRLARLPTPNLDEGDLADAIRSIVRFVKPEMEAAGIDLEQTIDDDLPSVAFDEAQLRQALLNLLRNAREAQPKGGWVTIGASVEEDGVRIEVIDGGEGIDAEARERIFDLFFTTKELGSGLGLPLTQQIVAAHGGQILCHAADTGGTRFALWLPAS